MTLPEAASTSTSAGGDMPLPGSLYVTTLKKRSDFLRAARAKRAVTPGFILQARTRSEPGPIRVGFTCSKKVGNAVARNRAKRRLREVARLVLSQRGVASTDYVLIGRAQVTATRPFEMLVADCHAALDQLS